MDQARRILLLLEAHEIVGAEGIRPRPEPIVVLHGHASFGTIGGVQSLADLQDLMTLVQYRMTQMNNSFGAFSPTWVAKDSGAFIDWSSDWAGLQKRVEAAVAKAKGLVSINALSPVPNSVIPAGDVYAGLQKAMRACAPPDGCPVIKGDWADLFSRLTAAQRAAGFTAIVDAPPQPVATDADLSFYAPTASLDVIAQVTGEQKAGPLGPGPLSEIEAILKWLHDHRQALAIGGVVVVGGVVLGVILPFLLAPLKAAKTLAAVAAA